MVAIGWLLQDSRNDRLEFRHRADEATGTTVGVSLQTGMATPVCDDWWSAVQFPIGIVHLFDDTLHMGRLVYPSEEHDQWYEV